MLRKLKIIAIQEYNYLLIDKDHKKYNLSIQFMDLEKMPQVNDDVYISEEALKETDMFTFGKINTEKIEEEELIKIVGSNQECYLQRYYG